MKNLWLLTLLMAMNWFKISNANQQAATDTDDSELMAYLKEIKFDAEVHRQLMRMEIFSSTCDRKSYGVTSFSKREE